MNLLTIKKPALPYSTDPHILKPPVPEKKPLYFICNDKDEVNILSMYVDEQWKNEDKNGDPKPIVLTWNDYIKLQRSMIKEVPNIDTIDIDDYFTHLKTKEYGRLLIYGEVVSSTQDILMNKFKLFQKGLIAVADEQVKGRGRTTNKWVSPRGCLMFSFKLQLSNPNYVCFVQYIISLCIVRGIKQIPECKDVDIGIKWPNDIYINKKLKIGGILCQSIYAGTFDITVGCGININNYKPSTCIDKEVSAIKNSPTIISRGHILANIMNELEVMWTQFVDQGFEPFLNEYLSLWLHTNQKVHVNGDTGTTEAIIQGLTKEGYLLAVTDQGEQLQLLPDGNSFNFLEGLIYKKI